MSRGACLKEIVQIEHRISNRRPFPGVSHFGKNQISWRNFIQVVQYCVRAMPTENALTQAFLRWAGGKRHLLSNLVSVVPEFEGVYREPFLGAASLFFALKPQRAVLSDANEHLIRCYQYVRDQFATVSAYLNAHLSRTSERYYYDVRKQYNQAGASVAQAARFIYLNKTCFNGIFRVNQQGEFNVPYGWKEPPSIPSRAELQAASSALQAAMLKTADFEAALEEANREDFIYLDPPYPPLNGTAYFTHYTMNRFNESDQTKVARLFKELDRRGCPVLMTNADTKLIRRLYRTYDVTSVEVTRFLTCKKKYRVRELLITNYERSI